MFTCNMCSIDCNCVSNNPYKNNIDMKANEAPEKIYFSQTGDGRQYFTPAIPFEREFVEYMPVDAFIEKAVNFLEMLGYGFTITDNITHKNYDEEQLIADFRNYIKGE